uniref:FecR family protein n=1 Tax=uncultured Sphingomonas sp. TaxID=158754 RepID=UPI0035CC24C6
MSGRYGSAEERQAIEEEAARLYLKARESDAEPDWDTAYSWVELNPAHGVAFAKAEAGWELTDRLRERAPPVGPEAIAGPAGRFEALFSRRAMGALLAATLIGTVGTVAIQKWAVVDRYRTAIGQERAFRLQDGSIVRLNTDSAIEVAMQNDQRFVRLLKGEARFDVAHNPARPFIVRAGDSTLRAVGTAFNVRLRPELTELTVIEGRVAVRDSGAAARTVAAGSAAAIRGGTVAVTRLEKVQLVQRTAWQTGVIQFDGETLDQAVAEFNRYRHTPIVIGDPQLASIRIGGTFKPGNSEQFVGALRASFGIRSVGDKGDSIILLPGDRLDKSREDTGRTR